jgi:SAM-dependent methyltransferase
MCLSNDKEKLMDATTRKSDDPVPHGSSSSGCDIRHLKRRITFLRNLTEASLSRAGVERASRVLDLGCGTGDASLLIAKLVGPSGLVVGVERSAEAIDVAQKRATVTGQCYWAMFVVADPDMFVATEQFDMVLVRLSLSRLREHLLRLSTHVRLGGVIAIASHSALLSGHNSSRP